MIFYSFSAVIAGLGLSFLIMPQIEDPKIEPLSACIRAYGIQEKFLQESLVRIDRYTRTAITYHNLNRCVIFHSALPMLTLDFN
jgi:hypothetical protein